MAAEKLVLCEQAEHAERIVTIIVIKRAVHILSAARQSAFVE